MLHDFSMKGAMDPVTLDCVLGIDPGTSMSALVLLHGDGVGIGWRRFVANEEAEALLLRVCPGSTRLAIEWIQHMGMPAGADLFHTARWVGRFEKTWATNGGSDPLLIPRARVKAALCRSTRAKDSHIRQSLIDRWGGNERAIGGKKCERCNGKGWSGRGRPTCTSCSGSGWRLPPGPLRGFAGHEWAALAVAVVARRELNGEE